MHTSVFIKTLELIKNYLNEAVLMSNMFKWRNKKYN